ncbi:MULTISPECIES: site-2 protease family protein [Haloarcula]|uniref:Site-2 protease family protein n=1 Tax=Haloarcula pellucida TaxID=1427151 RepID=A0A830GLA1_9EURY|nr:MULTISPECIES: site-2 protease family protein [Halomicroarcula]MBX0348815.1 site-2 protease family protein [Halomicroarcula pellucida]MDS0278578.1 site-2 protease family protein [Halomicroarcula sp. S1AR25-4]GGN91687.1 site-2 protease family protein [Halomicroarcula pellucida]
MSRPADEPPSPADLSGAFHVAAVRQDGETVRYFGDPLVPPDAVVDELGPLFSRRGFDLRLERQSATGTTDGGHDLVSAPPQPYALVAEPTTTGPDGVPWLNVGLLLVTIASSLYVGASSWYYIPVLEQPLRIFEAWPFVAAMLGVLGIHELGHYAAARYYGVDVTLPYFIPFPSLLGTLGAVINIRGQIPDRRALFDIGVAGPLAGLVATVVVTVVGLTLEPITVPQSVLDGGAQYAFRFHDPLLMQGLQGFVDVMGWGVEYGPNESVHPVVFAGWAGMFFTFLNLLPVGQLDGGHIVRAIVGQRQETIAAAVPGALFALAGFLYLTRDAPPIGFGVWSLWAFWGLFATGLAYAGPARPTVDEPLDRRRILLGIATFALGVACFTPVPFEIVAA